MSEGSDGSMYDCVCMWAVKQLDTNAAVGHVLGADESGERDLPSGRVVKGWMYGIENGCEYDVGRKGSSDGGRDVPFMGSSRICMIILAGGQVQWEIGSFEDRQMRGVVVRKRGLQGMELKSKDAIMLGCRCRAERNFWRIWCWRKRIKRYWPPSHSGQWRADVPSFETMRVNWKNQVFCTK